MPTSKLLKVNPSKSTAKVKTLLTKLEARFKETKFWLKQSLMNSQWCMKILSFEQYFYHKSPSFLVLYNEIDYWDKISNLLSLYKTRNEGLLW